MNGQPIVLRKSKFIRRDGIPTASGWVQVADVSKISRYARGNYLYKVDGIEYCSRSEEWLEKLSEFQMWSNLQK